MEMWVVKFSENFFVYDVPAASADEAIQVVKSVFPQQLDSVPLTAERQ